METVMKRRYITHGRDMNVLVTREMMNNRKAVDIRIEEIADISFDLSESGEYVDIGAISGRLLVEYELNHGAIRDHLERAEEPGILDRFRLFIEEGDPEAIDTSRLSIQYGSLLMRGTEPLEEVQEHLELTANVSAREFKQTSPDDLKRKLRQEETYELTYDDIESDILAYLDREGINTEQVSMGSPVHLQARASPIADDDEDLYGTRFTITVENRAPREIDPSTISVSMPPAIGRELVTMEGTDGAYDAAENAFEFDVPGIGPADGRNAESYELSFVVPQSAGADLERIEGSATLNTTQPFTNYLPQAVFDAGGQKLYDGASDDNAVYADVRATCSIEADFSTPTADVMVGETALVEKKITVEGITPLQAEEKIESVLRQRGIDTTGQVDQQGTEIRESAEVTTFSGAFEGGSVVVGDTRINISLSINGERRTGETGTERTGDGELPAMSRNVSIDYGRTGVTVRGRGADAEKVDSYVSDLRDELRLELESIAEEV